jgi:uncharacterized protein
VCVVADTDLCDAVAVELMIDADGAQLPATLDRPAGPVRGGLIALHGAQGGQRSYFLYEHLAKVLPSLGVAVLRYDRRPGVDGADVPLVRQAADARAAIGTLREHTGSRPVMVWGFSQGAWAAPVTAATYPDSVDALVLVSSCGVSPALQMRIGTAQQLSRRGYGEADLRQLAELRAEVEAYLRGQRDRATTQALVHAAAERPWFPLVYLDRELPAPGAWDDMDFEPEPVFAQVRCPVLAFYGETDEWMPIDESVAAWGRAGRASANTEITVVRLAGCDHVPTLDERQDIDGISPQYTETLVTWLEERLRQST